MAATTSSTTQHSSGNEAPECVRGRFADGPQRSWREISGDDRATLEVVTERGRA